MQRCKKQIRPCKKVGSEVASCTECNGGSSSQQKSRVAPRGYEKPHSYDDTSFYSSYLDSSSSDSSSCSSSSWD